MLKEQNTEATQRKAFGKASVRERYRTKNGPQIRGYHRRVRVQHNLKILSGFYSYLACKIIVLDSTSASK